MPEQIIRERQIVDHLSATYTRKNNHQLLSFDSNDYLGLASDPRLIEAAQSTLKNVGFGTRSSALLSGYSSEHMSFENELAQFLNVERVICFSTGYMANVGLISTLFNRSNRLLLDRRCHASIIDGVKLSGAKFNRYRDYVNLNEQYDAIITEGVFSMEGDAAPLDKIIPDVRSNQWLIVDDAHAIGWAGTDGRGSTPHTPSKNTIIVGTLSKSFGCHGAFVAGSIELTEQLIQRARSYIYTTALPPHIINAARAALTIIQTEPEHRTRLLSNIDYFQRHAKNKLPSHSPIQSIIIGDNDQTVTLKKQLEKLGILTQAIRPPTVPNGTARIRISLNAKHTHQHIDQLLEALEHATTHTTA